MNNQIIKMNYMQASFLESVVYVTRGTTLRRRKCDINLNEVGKSEIDCLSFIDSRKTLVLT